MCSMIVCCRVLCSLARLCRRPPVRDVCTAVSPVPQQWWYNSLAPSPQIMWPLQYCHCRSNVRDQLIIYIMWMKNWNYCILHISEIVQGYSTPIANTLELLHCTHAQNHRYVLTWGFVSCHDNSKICSLPLNMSNVCFMRNIQSHNKVH